MSTPAHISANFLNVPKSTGSRTAACDYARNHFTHFWTIFDIFESTSVYLSHSIFIATIYGYESCIHKIY